jgi:hypothetical protein
MSSTSSDVVPQKCCLSNFCPEVDFLLCLPPLGHLLDEEADFGDLIKEEEHLHILLENKPDSMHKQICSILTSCLQPLMGTAIQLWNGDTPPQGKGSPHPSFFLLAFMFISKTNFIFWLQQLFGNAM